MFLMKKKKIKKKLKRLKLQDFPSKGYIDKL